MLIFSHLVFSGTWAVIRNPFSVAFGLSPSSNSPPSTSTPSRRPSWRRSGPPEMAFSSPKTSGAQDQGQCHKICRNSKLQRCSKWWFLGCMNPASWPPLAAGLEFAPPRNHLLDNLCIGRRIMACMWEWEISSCSCVNCSCLAFPGCCITRFSNRFLYPVHSIEALCR